MNKQELIENIATSADITKAAAGRALDSMIDSIANSLKKAILSFLLVLVRLVSEIVQRALAGTYRLEKKFR